MNFKNKFNAVLVLTVGVLLASGLYFYNFSDNNSTSEHEMQSVTYIVPENIISEIDLSEAKLSASKIGKATRRKRTAGQISQMGSFSGSDFMTDINPSVSVSLNSGKSWVNTTRSVVQEETYSTSTASFTAGLMSMSGGSSKLSRTIAGSSMAASASIGSISAPFAAPRVSAGGNKNVILVDPGVMDIQEDQRIPVGGGLWIMLVLGLIYFAKPFFRMQFSKA